MDMAIVCGSSGVGFICIAYLAIANDNNWHLFLILRWNNETDWDFLIRILDGTSRELVCHSFPCRSI